MRKMPLIKICSVIAAIFLICIFINIIKNKSNINKSADVPAKMLNEAIEMSDLGKEENAIKVLQRLVIDHPSSKQATTARGLLVSEKFAAIILNQQTKIVSVPSIALDDPENKDLKVKKFEKLLGKKVEQVVLVLGQPDKVKNISEDGLYKIFYYEKEMLEISIRGNAVWRIHRLDENGESLGGMTIFRVDE